MGDKNQTKIKTLVMHNDLRLTILFAYIMIRLSASNANEIYVPRYESTTYIYIYIDIIDILLYSKYFY